MYAVIWQNHITKGGVLKACISIEFLSKDNARWGIFICHKPRVDLEARPPKNFDYARLLYSRSLSRKKGSAIKPTTKADIYTQNAEKRTIMRNNEMCMT